MLTTVSFGTRRTGSHNFHEYQSRYHPYESSQAVQLLRTDKNDTYYESNQMTINGRTTNKSWGSSTSMLMSLMREIRTKRELRQRKLTTNESELEFLNQESLVYERKYKVYNFFNKPKTFSAIFYHILVFILVFTCLIFTVFSSIKKYSIEASKVLTILEKVIIVWFCNEFCLRLWSSSCKHTYDGWAGKWRYIRVPSHLLDLTVIIVSVVVLIADTRNGSEVFAVSAIRGFHRLFRVFQILTLHRQIQPWKLLKKVVQDQLHQLLIILYIEFISIFILAYISYMLEKDATNSQFNNLAEAMWWAVITLSTVGYGDKIHVTWWGKLISSLFTILGVALFALPAGIIGAGLAIRVEKEESNRQRKRKKLSAIVLIQSMWRCYRASECRELSKHGGRSSSLFILNSSDRIALKFIRLTAFFVAKSKFKSTQDIWDLDNAFNSYKFSQLEVNTRVKHITNIIDTIDKNVLINEKKFLSSQSIILNRIENIRTLSDYIETEISRQNVLIDFISLNSVLNTNELIKLSHLLIDSKKKRKNSVNDRQFGTKTFYWSNCSGIKNKHHISKTPGSHL